ncbi:MAG: hypothetical protein QNL03_14140 [Gammaproteobacteria bacterium]|nr:hypothetical protein [Gammaproteobacteria bacterium]
MNYAISTSARLTSTPAGGSMLPLTTCRHQVRKTPIAMHVVKK